MTDTSEVEKLAKTVNRGIGCFAWFIVITIVIPAIFTFLAIAFMAISQGSHP